MSSDTNEDDGDGDAATTTTATVVFSTFNADHGDNLGNNKISSTNNDEMTHSDIIIPSSNISLQQSNWQGAIPVVISLAPTSLSSPMAPRPIHAMISRCNFLHVALYTEIMTLANYAPFSAVGRAAANNHRAQEVGAATTTATTSTMGVMQSDGMILMRAEEPPDDDVNEDNNNHDVNASVVTRNKKDEGGKDNNNVNRHEEISHSNTHSTRHHRSNATETFPECWFEDVITGIPLRWQLFAGILYDLVKGKSMVAKNGNTTSRQSPRRHRRMEYSQFLPWQIRVHFTRYPHDKILALDDGGGGVGVGGSSVLAQQNHHHRQPAHRSSEGNDDDDDDDDILHRNNNSAHRRIDALISRTYRNSLKQALFLQYGTSRTAMSMKKQSHEQLWDAIQACNYEKFCEVNSRLQRGVECRPVSTTASPSLSSTIGGSDNDNDIPQLIPVRLMLNDFPAIQRPIRHQRKRSDDNEDPCNDRKSALEKLMTMNQSPSYTTLGDFLADHFPHHFEIDSNGVTVRKKSAEDDDTHFYYCIQGIQPTLKCAMVDLWRCLSHPDHFLYVIVVKE